MFSRNSLYTFIYKALLLLPIQQALGLGHTPRPTSDSPTPAPYSLHPSTQPSTSTSLVPTRFPTGISTQLPTWLTRMPTYFYPNRSSPTAVTPIPMPPAEETPWFHIIVLIISLLLMSSICIFCRLKCCRSRCLENINNPDDADSDDERSDQRLLEHTPNKEYYDDTHSVNSHNTDALPPERNALSRALMDTLRDSLIKQTPVKAYVTELLQHEIKFVNPGIANEIKVNILKKCTTPHNALNETGKILLALLKAQQNPLSRFGFSLEQSLHRVPLSFLILLHCILEMSSSPLMRRMFSKSTNEKHALLATNPQSPLIELLE